MIDFSLLPRRNKTYAGANGSSLFPQADEIIMESVLNEPAERDARVFKKMPLSGIRQDGQKINYFDFIYAGNNQDCNTALKRILPHIDM